MRKNVLLLIIFFTSYQTLIFPQDDVYDEIMENRLKRDRLTKSIDNLYTVFQEKFEKDSCIDKYVLALKGAVIRSLPALGSTEIANIDTSLILKYSGETENNFKILYNGDNYFRIIYEGKEFYINRNHVFSFHGENKFCYDVAQITMDIDLLEREKKIVNQVISVLADKIKYMKENNILTDKQIIKKYGKKIGRKLLDKLMWIGMTKEMCQDAFGKPDKIISTVTSKSKDETWRYGLETFLYFVNGKLTSWQQAIE